MQLKKKLFYFPKKKGSYFPFTREASAPTSTFCVLRRTQNTNTRQTRGKRVNTVITHGRKTATGVGNGSVVHPPGRSTALILTWNMERQRRRWISHHQFLLLRRGAPFLPFRQGNLQLLVLRLHLFLCVESFNFTRLDFAYLV